MLVVLVLFQIWYMHHQDDFTCTINKTKQNNNINFDEPYDKFLKSLTNVVHNLHIGS